MKIEKKKKKKNSANIFCTISRIKFNQLKKFFLNIKTKKITSIFDFVVFQKLAPLANKHRLQITAVNKIDQTLINLRNEPNFGFFRYFRKIFLPSFFFFF